MAGYTFVQAPVATIVTGNPISATISYVSDVTSGNLLYTAARIGASGSMSDNLAGSGSWTALPIFGTNGDKYHWYKVTTASGPMTITFNSGVGATFRMVCAEYSNNISTPLDGTISTANTVTANTRTVGPSATVFGNHDLILTVCLGFGTTDVTTVDTGYTVRAHVAGADGKAMFADILDWSGPAVASATWNYASGSTTGDIAIMGFLAVGGGDTTPDGTRPMTISST